MKRHQPLSKLFFLVGFVLITAACIMWCIFSGFPLITKIGSSLSILPNTGISLTPKSTPTPTPEPDHSTNMLLLGYGGGTHEGTYLTDSMLILRVDPDRKKTFLISLPRDLWVRLPVTTDGKGSKINAAYAYGLDDEQFPDKPKKYVGDAGALLMVKDIVTETTGIRIDHAVAVDFSGFTTGLDTLGGIDVNVPRSFTDKEYPVEGKEKDLCGKSETEATDLLKDATSAAIIFPCRYETISFTQGTTHLDGATALKYVRSRHAENYGGDFSRSERQRSLIIAVKNKLLTMGSLSKIPDLYRTFSRMIRTDLSATDIASLATHLTEWSEYPITNVGLSDENVLDMYTTEDKQSALIALDGLFSTKLIHAFMRDEVKPELSKTAPIVLLRGAKLDFSRLSDIKKTLDTNGLPVLDIESSTKNVATQSSIAIYGKMAPSVIEFFMRTFPGVPFTTTEKKYLTYDIVFTIAPQPTPTVTPKIQK
jgi:anionic cell wall polymer biosynthesis LytR-Cps2A-Psr (LCP) family protein